MVLWTAHFDAVAATALTAAFRQAGIRVKIVGLVAAAVTGANGLTLTPDLLLEPALALADHAIVIVIPGAAGAVCQLDNDPRVRELLTRARAHQAAFITSVEATQAVAALLKDQDVPLTIVPYPPDLGMSEFVEHLIAMLCMATPSGTEMEEARRSHQASKKRQSNCSTT